MKVLTLLALLLLTTQFANAQTSLYSPDMGVKKSATFSPTYGCRSAEEFYQKGYEGTALFLSDSMKKLNSPDLVFNGACRSKNYFHSASEFSFIADITTTNITLLLSSLASVKDKHDLNALNKLGFNRRALAVSGHSYAVLLDKKGINGLFVFTVSDFVPDQRAVITYKVLDYQITPEYLKVLKTLQANWVAN